MFLADVAAAVQQRVRKRSTPAPSVAVNSSAMAAALPPGPSQPPPQEHLAASLDRLIGGVGVGLLLAAPESIPTLIDAMLHENVMMQFAESSVDALSALEIPDTAAFHRALDNDLSQLPSESARIVRGALLLQHELSRYVLEAVARQELESMEKLAPNEVSAMRSWYLTEAPLEVSERFVLAERGNVALFGVMAVLHPIARAQGYSLVTLQSLARISEAGSRAMLSLFASVWPQRVPLAVVPQSERIDIEAVTRRDAEQAEALAQIASQVDDDEVRWLLPR